MGNPLGIHAGVWIGQWSPDETRHAVERTKAAGYDVLEVTGSDPTSIDADLLRGLLADAGLGATVSLGLDFDADVSSLDGAVRARGEQRLLAALELAAAIGATTLAGCVYSALGKYPAPATDAHAANAAAAVRDLAAAAAEHGIGVALEVVNRYESNLFNTAEGALRFLDAVGRDDVTVHLDTYHMNIEEADMARPVHLLGDRLGYVHIGESHRGHLGSGSIDWPTFFRALVTSGYTGGITFESFSSAVVDPTLSNTLAVWRNLWSDNRELAEHALAYIRAELLSARAATGALA